ncbi:hypothetical protein QAD02_020774 [Eretmocerus hayati]|uniref:Uncharacterized protein n=1 Tax=Eretmocerus hayati TaxID=131215 RepID=A0ACC2PNB3_9HYME|nr:hypothetical protein QAD02_020774 [Eretmocerus hayati]
MRDAVKSKTESWWSKRLRVKELLASMEQEEELDQSEIDSLNDEHNEDGVEDEGSTSQDTESIESNIDTLKNRILEQMTNSTDNTDIKEIFGSLMITVLHPLPLTAVTMKQLSAKVRCIDTCKKLLKVQYEDGKNWNVGNFLRHFYKFHSPADAPRRKIVKKRKTSKTTKTNVISEVPPSQDPTTCNDTRNSPANTRDAQNIFVAQENQDIAAAQDIQGPLAEHPASCIMQHQITEQVANSSNLAEDSGIDIDSSIAGPSQMNYSGTLDLSRRASDASVCAEIYAQSSSDGTISVVRQTESATSLIQLSDFAHA